MITKPWLSLTLFAVLVLGVAFGARALVASLISWVMSQESQVAAAIITFAGTVVVGVGTVVYSQQKAKAREAAEAHRPKKVDLYSGFITNVVGIMRAHKGGRLHEASVKEEIENFFFNFTKDLMLWGSPSVLRHYRSFRTSGTEPSVDAILLLDDVLGTMRRDLGLSNLGLARGDLIKLLLTDPDKVDALVTEGRRRKSAPATSACDPTST